MAGTGLSKQKIKILIADDNKDVNVLLSATLELKGYEAYKSTFTSLLSSAISILIFCLLNPVLPFLFIYCKCLPINYYPSTLIQWKFPNDSKIFDKSR